MCMTVHDGDDNGAYKLCVSVCAFCDKREADDGWWCCYLESEQQKSKEKIEMLPMERIFLCVVYAVGCSIKCKV